MSTITESSTWSATINQIESGELLEGGAGNLLNQASGSLANRTLYLRNTLNAHTSTANIHRELNDSSSALTELWSASKIQTELSTISNNIRIPWSIKTSNYTASHREGIFANTSGGAFTITLPTAQAIGDVIYIVDSHDTWDVNNLTVGRNGANINSLAEDLICDVQGCSIKVIYCDGTIGWKIC